MTKLYYSIKETSDLVDEEQHILRYWEKEFTILKPKKNKAGNRTYTHKDLQIILKIKSMIREEHLSLKEAKENFKTIKLNDLIDESFDVNKPLNNESDKLNLVTNNNVVVDVAKKLTKELTEELSEVVSGNQLDDVNNKISDVDKSNQIQNESIYQINESVNNESLIDFDFDKKIILRNHLFEDYEEFSIFDLEKYNDLKNSKNSKEKDDLNKFDDYGNVESKNQLNSKVELDGIVLSYDSLKSLIMILKEIRNLVIK